jgi:hypothetical protein
MKNKYFILTVTMGIAGFNCDMDIAGKKLKNLINKKD